MSVILNLETKNETLNNVISNNPFYIDIKGSVNICLVRCGQEIEACESVNFSTMTNYGKILVLNKSTTSNSKCAIKLAFDSSNDTINNKGDANYNFESAFVTVPSLHKLNGVIYDMETFLVFSSVQKNGNVLYVCLCTFNMGVNSVPQGDWKLLNYKLMDELFVQKNIVPDIFGTNEITGVPNPVDINNFIPKKGFRNFYDYTHPQNTKVNFRVFQTPLSVSNNVINTLKSKLTPGNTYVNFKNAISQSINPLEGLFFYFSEDLTDRYKSFAANNPPPAHNHLKEILEEEEQRNDNVLKKLDTINEEDKILEEDNSFNEENENKESFESNSNQVKALTTYGIFLLITVFCMMGIYTYMVKNFFKETNGISEEDLINYTNDIFDPNMSKVISSKFKMNTLFIIQFIITFIVIFLLVITIPLSNQNTNTNSIFISAIVFIFLLIFVIIFIFYYYFRYLFYRMKGFYDDDFSQKENYLYNFIKSKIYNSSFFSNLYNIFKENFTSFLINVPSQNIKYNNIQTGGNQEFDHAPGNVSNNYINAKIAENKQKLDQITYFSFVDFLELINNDFVKEKFKDNKQYMQSFYTILFFIIIFYVFGSILQLTFSSIGDIFGIKFILSFLVSFVLYSPICFMLINSVYSIQNDKLKYTIYTFSAIIILLSFTIFFNPINDIPINNIGFWISFGLIIMSIIIIFVEKKYIKSSGSGLSTVTPNPVPNPVGGPVPNPVGGPVPNPVPNPVPTGPPTGLGTLPPPGQVPESQNSLLKEISILKNQLQEKDSKINLLENHYDNQNNKKINPTAPPENKEYLSEMSILQNKIQDKNSELYLLKEYIENELNNNLDNNKIGIPISTYINELKNQQNEINRLQKELLKIKDNLNLKTKKYNFLISQFDNSKKEIELLKKIIPNKNLVKTIDYLKFISGILYEVQQLKNTEHSKEKNDKILELLKKLSNIDNPTHMDPSMLDELKTLSEENNKNYQFILNKIQPIIEKIKDTAKSILNNLPNEE